LKKPESLKFFRKKLNGNLVRDSEWEAMRDCKTGLEEIQLTVLNEVFAGRGCAINFEVRHE
jgi:hypothetical protein